MHYFFTHLNILDANAGSKIADGNVMLVGNGFLPVLGASWLPPLLRDHTRFNTVLLYAALSVQGIGFDEMYNV